MASDKWGRKKLILFSDGLFTLGAIVMAWSPTIPWLMVGRLLVGLGVGIAAQIVPLYLSEVAPIQIRGRVIAVNNFMITGGQLISVILVFILKPNWRLMLGLAGVPSTLQFIGMLFLPESPRWLGKVEQDAESRSIIKSIYKPAYVEPACAELKKEVEKLKVETKLGELERIKILFTQYGRCLVIGCGV